MQIQAPNHSASKDKHFHSIAPCFDDSFNQEYQEINAIDKHSFLTTSFHIQIDTDNFSGQGQNIKVKSNYSKLQGVSSQYTTNRGKSILKKYLQKSQIEICESVLQQLNNHITSFSFRFPVDPDSQGLPDYYEKVVNPMDLQTIRLKLARDRYTKLSQFYKDIELIISNSLFYNHKNDDFIYVTYQFQKIYLKLQKEYDGQKSRPKAKRVIAQKKKRQKQVYKKKETCRKNIIQIKANAIKLFQTIEKQKQSVAKSISQDKQMSEIDKQTDQILLDAEPIIKQHDSSGRIQQYLDC